MMKPLALGGSEHLAGININTMPPLSAVMAQSIATVYKFSGSFSPIFAQPCGSNWDNGLETGIAHLCAILLIVKESRRRESPAPALCYTHFIASPST